MTSGITYKMSAKVGVGIITCDRPDYLKQVFLESLSGLVKKLLTRWLLSTTVNTVDASLLTAAEDGYQLIVLYMKQTPQRQGVGKGQEPYYVFKASFEERV
jgi:hypothetical protein